MGDKFKCVLGENIPLQLCEGEDLADELLHRVGQPQSCNEFCAQSKCVCVCAEKGQRLLPTEGKGAGEDLGWQMLAGTRCAMVTPLC